MATPEEKRDGITWYAEAEAICKRMALKHDIPSRVVVGVAAALSPNNKWERNIFNADDLIGAFLNGEDIDSVKRKAWSILEQMPDHDRIISILNGQKIVSFYRNIMGDDTCTVDGHARNIYYGERLGLTDDRTNIGKKEYSIISQAYVDAAKRTRANGRALKAFELQAITWVVWRRIHNIT